MLPELARKQMYVEMFVDEARIVGQLGHPNICQLIELGEEDGVPFIALEYVRGDSLSGLWDRAIASDVTVPRAITLRLLADTAWALHYAHEARDADGQPLNVIHRDISPHNVMVGFHGDVKLMDFGIARAENRLHRTDTGKVKGKISYMAPEQLRGQPLDRRADVFAVGVMLWELTLSRRLFGGNSEVETLQKAAECRVPPPSSIDPSYPPGLERIVLGALAADAGERTATAGEIAEALIGELNALGGAERRDVAALMRRLYPDEVDVSEDTVPDRTWIDSGDLELFEKPADSARPRRTAPLIASDASMPRPTVPLRSQSDPSLARPTVPMRSEGSASDVRPTVPMRSESAEAVPLAPLAAAARARGSRRWLAWLVTALVASAAGVAMVAMFDRTTETVAPTVESPASAAASPPPVPAAVSVAPTPSQNDVEAAKPSPPAPPLPSPTRSQTRVEKRGSRPAAPTVQPAAGAAQPAQTTGTPTERISEPPQEPAPAADVRGTLAVSSEVTGVVVIDGVRHKSTPFQILLSAGPHDVAVELGEGAGTLRASASVLAGRKTKCKANRTALACGSP